MSSKKLGDYRKGYDNSNEFYRETEFKMTDYGVLDDHTSNIIKNKQYIFENVKNQELLELEEEEEYLNRIRNEKQQVENMQREFSSYQSLIQNLQNQLEKYQKYKPYYEKYQSIKQLLEKTLSKLESKETENQILQNQIGSLKDERDQLLQKQIEIQKEKADLSQYVTKCDQLNAQMIEIKMKFSREFQDKEKQFLKDLNQNQQYETKLKDELAQTQCKLEEAILQIKRLKEENQSIGLKQDSYEDKYQVTQQKLIECLKELDKSKEQVSRLSFEVQQKRIEIAECQEIKRQLSSNANILKRQEILFEELKTSKAEDDQRIQLLQDELDLKEKELTRSKQLNMKLSEEYDGCVHKIVEFERELALYRKENHELKRNLSILMEKQQNEKAYKDEVNRVKQDLYNIRNSELDKFNSVFDYIMSPQSNLNKSKN